MTQGPEPERKLLLVLEYDGTGYAGFQAQAGQPTVQESVERAFLRLTGERVRLAAASRTDAGVHARGQVVTLRTHGPLAVERFVGGLNRYLPLDISVREGRFVPLAFDPRRHACGRTYRYTILNRPAPSPLQSRFAYHLRESLDVEAMRRSALHLLGRWDLRSFAAEPGPGRSTVRRVDRAEVWQAGELVLLEMEADAFLPQQVRRTAGALVRVGQGRLSPGSFQQMVCRPQPGAAAWSLPPQGLCLMAVTYPDWETEDKHEDL